MMNTQSLSTLLVFQLIFRKRKSFSFKHAKMSSSGFPPTAY